MTKTNELALISKAELSHVHDTALNEHQLQKILARTPRQYIREREGKGGQKWRYVTVGYIKKVLNLMFGFDWDFEIVSEQIVGGSVVVKGKLTCRSNGKEIVKMQFGSKEIMYKNDYVDNGKGGKTKVKTDQPLDIGNDFKAAASDCLKKCAADIGIAADVYNADEFKEVYVKEAQKGYKDAIE